MLLLFFVEVGAITLFGLFEIFVIISGNIFRLSKGGLCKSLLVSIYRFPYHFFPGRASFLEGEKGEKEKKGVH